MNTITTTSRFANEPVKIPAAVNENAGESKNTGLDNVIQKSERKLLREALGDTQYAALQDALGKEPFTVGSSETADDAYIELVNGSSDSLWEGLRPLLDNFIYCEWMRVVEVKLNHVGSGKGKSQGFSVADNSSKFAENWNTFVEKLCELEEYLGDAIELERPEDFPVYETVNSLGL